MKKAKAGTIITWVLQVLMGLEFVLAGVGKFTMQDLWITKFRDWGLPDNFYLLIGGLELIGGVLIFIPKLAAKVALGLLAIMIGATLTHAFSQEWRSITLPLILSAILIAVFILRKDYGKNL